MTAHPRAAAHGARAAAAALAIVAMAIASVILRPVERHAGSAGVPSRAAAVEAASVVDGPVPAFVGAVVRSGAELAAGRSARGAVEIAALAAALLIAATRRRARVALVARRAVLRHAAVPCASRAPPQVLAS